MNIFKRFKKPTPIVTPLSEYEQHEQRLIEGVIEQQPPPCSQHDGGMEKHWTNQLQTKIRQY